MDKLKPSDPPLPDLDQLDWDDSLTKTTVTQRWLALSKPFFWFLIYVIAHTYEYFVLGELALIISVAHGVSVWHDLTHNNLDMSNRSCDIALTVIGLYLLQSGHAFKAHHKNHHKAVPNSYTVEDDPEGYPATLPLWKVLAYGPIFWQRCWLWVYKYRPKYRKWIVPEMLGCICLWSVGLWQWLNSGSTLMLHYLITIQLMDFLADLIFVWIIHYKFEHTELKQARTFRGRFFADWLMAGTYYHLEHHLYQPVGVHNLPKLAARLDDWLESNYKGKEDQYFPPTKVF